jgi:hypothetical protein
MEDWEVADLMEVIRDAIKAVDESRIVDFAPLRKVLEDYDQDQIDLTFIRNCCC